METWTKLSITASIPHHLVSSEANRLVHFDTDPCQHCSKDILGVFSLAAFGNKVAVQVVLKEETVDDHSQHHGKKPNRYVVGTIFVA